MQQLPYSSRNRPSSVRGCVKLSQAVPWHAQDLLACRSPAGHFCAQPTWHYVRMHGWGSPLYTGQTGSLRLRLTITEGPVFSFAVPPDTTTAKAEMREDILTMEGTIAGRGSGRVAGDEEEGGAAPAARKGHPQPAKPGAAEAAHQAREGRGETSLCPSGWLKTHRIILCTRGRCSNQVSAAHVQKRVPDALRNNACICQACTQLVSTCMSARASCFTG